MTSIQLGRLHGHQRSRLFAGMFFAVLALFSASSAWAQTFKMNPDIAVQLIATSRVVNLQQGNGLRFVDAWDDGTHDHSVVTRDFQNNNSQKWRMTQVAGNIYTFQQLSSGRFLDAHETGAKGYDYRMVTRPQQNNSSQQWRLIGYGGSYYTMQNVLLGRYADNSLSPALDFQLMTRPEAAGSNSQSWLIVDAD